MTDKLESSALYEALKSRPRKVHVFPVDNLVGLDGTLIHEVAFRVPTKREQDLAIAAAHAYVSKLAEKNPRVADDPDVILDAKSCAILSVMLRDPARPDKMPIFPTCESVAELLTTDHIGSLVGVANQVRRTDSPDPDDINDDQVEAIASMCVLGAASDIPEVVLAKFSRTKLEQLCVFLSLKLDAARAKDAVED